MVCLSDLSGYPFELAALQKLHTYGDILKLIRKSSEMGKVRSGTSIFGSLRHYRPADSTTKSLDAAWPRCLKRSRCPGINERRVASSGQQASDLALCG